MEPNKINGRSPISWVPTLYFAMGMPFVVLNMVCVLMFKGLDVSDAQIALWTSIIMFPWTLKPLWSPLLEMYKTKKFFVIVTQAASSDSWRWLCICPISLPYASHCWLS